MNDLKTRYERLAEKADRLTEEIEMVEAYVEAMLSYTHNHGGGYQMTLIEDFLNAVFAVESDRRQHLLHVRFEKALLSCQIQKQV